MNGNGIRGIEQGRAKFAYDSVNEIAQNSNGDLKKKYKSGAKKLPMLIKTNGLGQALAFINMRDDGNIELYNMIRDWLSQKQLIELGTNTDLVAIVIDKPSNEYRRITTETLALLNWVRRFVDGLMKGVEEDN
ncbi:MAG: type III-B CRISPR module-associated protein Cmr5 [Candidatus Poribacteria bacterium]|nr:type III-B CRISPR module-associated protein Cmr5 [Candidatus Poribacteria bacterium]